MQGMAHVHVRRLNRSDSPEMARTGGRYSSMSPQMEERTEWPCDVCGTLWKDARSLGNHKNAKNHHIPVPCPWCSQKFKTEILLLKHKSGSCKQISLEDKTNARELLAVHIKRARKKSFSLDENDKSMYVQCPICDKIFLGVERLREHNKGVHGNVKKLTAKEIRKMASTKEEFDKQEVQSLEEIRLYEVWSATSNFRCPECSFIVCRGMPAMRYHYKNVHCYMVTANEIKKMEVVEREEKYPITTDSSSRHWKHFPRHVALEIDLCMMKCPECDKICPHFRSLRGHYNKYHKEIKSVLVAKDPLTLLAKDEDRKRIQNMCPSTTFDDTMTCQRVREYRRRSSTPPLSDVEVLNEPPPKKQRGKIIIRSAGTDESKTIYV